MELTSPVSTKIANGTTSITAGIRRRLSNVFRAKTTLVGFLIVCALIAVALMASTIAVTTPETIDPTKRLVSPSLDHPFGTDHLGRDVFSRMVFGARISLAVGALVALVTGIVGGILGLLSGYYSRVDNIVMRFTDGLMAFPSILLALGLMASLGARASNVVIALSVVYTPRIIRIMRATTLTLRREDFVEAAIVLGAGDARILLRHILPNCLGPVNVQLTFIVAYAILSEAALSFLGVGVSPETATWGNILSEGRNYLYQAPWLTLIPGIAIMLTVLGLNLFGDGLRDVLDPRLKGAR